eukprot:541403-Rhodomonas_salina.1
MGPGLFYFGCQLRGAMWSALGMPVGLAMCSRLCGVGSIAIRFASVDIVWIGVSKCGFRSAQLGSRVEF